MTNTKIATKATPAADVTGRPAAQARILLFGDSHSHAVQRAIDKRKGKGQQIPLSAYRLLKEKSGGYSRPTRLDGFLRRIGFKRDRPSQIGDTTFEAFLKSVRRLRANDVVLSMIGGNQHAVFSTIQHPRPFDFFALETSAPSMGQEIIPYRALEDAFVTGLRRSDVKSLEALRKATPARIVHILPPPPKQDNAHIRRYHETLFANEDLASLGVSLPELRLKFWKLQTRVLEKLCGELGIEIMKPPARAVDQTGFLRPEFYAQDVTHANWRYGEWVLRQVEQRFTDRDAVDA